MVITELGLSVSSSDKTNITELLLMMGLNNKNALPIFRVLELCGSELAKTSSIYTDRTGEVV